MTRMKFNQWFILTSFSLVLTTFYTGIKLLNSSHYNRVKLGGVTGRENGHPTLEEILSEDEQFVHIDGGTPRPLLHNMAVPNILHFVWCEQRIFTFKPYLAIKSAIRNLEPFSVIFHSEKDRFVDRVLYHRWIFELEHDYSFFVDLRMDAETAKICHGNLESRRDAILKLLQGEGGMYVGENTWLLNLPPERFNVDLEMALKPGTMEGYVMMRKGLARSNDTLAGLVKRLKGKDHSKSCIMSEELPWLNMKNVNCMIVTERKYHNLLPTDIMKREDSFGMITRWIFYGTTKILKPEPNYDVLVPNIGHVAWMGANPPDFVFYLSVLSFIYVLKVDKVYVHSDRVPLGIHWDMLTSNKDVMRRLVNVIRPNPAYFFQHHYPPHAGTYALLSDFLRAEILVNYGGFYIDADAVWVKPFTREERAYDAAASYDWVRWSLPYPEIMNLGVSYAKKNSPFMRLWRARMRQKYDNQLGFVGTRMPYKVWERYPHTLRVDPHLQVMCYQLICHPTWESFFHNESIGHPQTGSMDNWMEDTHAVHWTHPNPPAFTNMSTLLRSKGLFADIGKMIMSKAGLLRT